MIISIRRSLGVFLIFCALPSLSQNSSFPMEDLKVQWEVMENSHQGQTQFLSALTFSNTGKNKFPERGWTLYFNFVRAVKSTEVGALKIEHVNGDLFRITPKEDFQGIRPGATLRVEFVASDWVVNYTDAPAGFYMVWDDEPDKGIPVIHYSIKPSTKPKQYLRFSGDKVGLITPEVIYAQNKSTASIAPDKLVKVLPSPLRYRETGASFNLGPSVEIVADPSFQREASYLADELGQRLKKKPLMVSEVSVKANAAKIYLLKEAMAAEAYRLVVDAQSIRITASSASGIFYGIQSMKMMMPVAVWVARQDMVVIPGVEISDGPRFGHRALFLDVSRNFQQKEQVLKLLDLMSLYKLNVLHFHLNDDEGWRIEIPGLPELTQVGGVRGHATDDKTCLPPSFGSGPAVDNPHGSGYYTRRDYIEILQYATARHILVIPEIETPGHARAAIKSMAARHTRLMGEGKKEEAERYLLHDAEDRSIYRSVQGWNDNVINVALPSAYQFLEKVTDELLLMYKDAGAPIHTIHFGGDEVPAGVWEKSPACQRLIADDAALEHTDDLWYYFFGKINAMLKARGLSLYGWEEIAMYKTKLDGQRHFIPNPDFVKDRFQVDVWNNVLGWGAEDLAYRLANAGYKVVLSCVSNLYFDMAYYKAFDEPGYYWGAFVDIDKPFYFIPFDYFKNAKEDKFGSALDRSIFVGKERLTDYGKENIVGIQGLLWSENVLGPELMEYMILPKMLGLAERAWAQDPAWAAEKDSIASKALYDDAWSAFVNVVGKRELPRLDYYHGGFYYRIPSPGAIVENGMVKANIQLPGLVIRYTTDGTEPTAKSKIYDGPLTAKGLLKLRAFDTRGRGGKAIIIDNGISGMEQKLLPR